MRLVRFEPVDRPIYEFSKFDIRINWGQDRAPADIQQTPGGGFDPHGKNESMPEPFDIVAGFEQFVPQDADDLQAKVDATRGLRGLYGKLYAQPYHFKAVNADNSYLAVERWIYARCVQVPFERTLRHYQYQPMSLIFTSTDWCWRGLPHSMWRFDRWFDELALRYRTSPWYADNTDWNAGGKGQRHQWDIGGFTGQMVTSPYRHRHRFVFDLPIDLLGDFEAGNVSDAIRAAFSQSKITLGNTANIRVVEAGQKWELVSNNGTYVIDKSPDVLTAHFSSGNKRSGNILVNKGNATVHDAIIYVIAANADITRCEIRGPKSHLMFTDRIAAGTALVIDCGKLTVESNGDNAYTREQFGIGADHKLAEWFVVEPGENEVRVDYELATPGGSTIAADVRPFFEIEWYDGWK